MAMKSAVIMYWMPITLWSMLKMYRRTKLSGGAACGGSTA
jgi:hypothetical protein